MIISFIDAGVLIAAALGEDDVSHRALDVLDDLNRTFAASDFVKLEILPKARYFKNAEEANFYDTFFDAVKYWPSDLSEVVVRAQERAESFGLSALDALHVAAALEVGAEELVTTEKPERAIHRAASVIRIKSLQT